MTLPNGQRTLTGKSFERTPIQGLLARLSSIFPARLHVSVTLDGRAVVLGREPGGPGTVAVIDPTVSRRHLVIEADATGKQHIAVDQRSRNGTWIDGRKLTGPVVLAPGALIRLGDVLLAYERSDAGEPLAWFDTPVVSRVAIPGESAAAHRLRAAVARAAPDPSPALVIGETGTGKEAIAAEMHRLSGRSGDIVAVNCAAISPNLIESDLFG